MQPFQKRLLNDFQKDFPLVPEPFKAIAENLGIDEQTVLHQLREWLDEGLLSRVGPVFRPNRVGVSTLAALAVPEDQLDEVARRVSALPQVNHNYQRTHRFNLWFVITAQDGEHLEAVLAELRGWGYPLIDLRMQREFHIDLGFQLTW